MWTYEHCVDTAAPPDAVFALLRDVATWPEWNPGVERVDLDGPFAAGTHGIMAMPGQDPLVFRLIWVEPGRGFEDETPIPGAEVMVRVRHQVDPLSDGGARVTYRCAIDGADADELAPELGPAVTGDFPDVMAALCARAEAVPSPR